MVQYIHQVYTYTWTHRCRVGSKSLCPFPNNHFKEKLEKCLNSHLIFVNAVGKGEDGAMKVNCLKEGYEGRCSCEIRALLKSMSEIFSVSSCSHRCLFCWRSGTYGRHLIIPSTLWCCSDACTELAVLLENKRFYDGPLWKSICSLLFYFSLGVQVFIDDFIVAFSG